MVVVRLANKALSDEDIHKILGGDAKIIKYAELGNLYDIDQLLPEEKDYCIILYEDRPNRGHWTAILKYNNLYEHFDSYGVKPDSELKWIGAKRNRQLHQDEPYLTQLLEKEEEKHIYNNVAYQSKDSRVNTCGSHVVHRLYRLKNDDMSLPGYYHYMKSLKDQTNVGHDVIVAELVNKWL
jgi:hypothetical protein